MVWHHSDMHSCSHFAADVFAKSWHVSADTIEVSHARCRAGMGSDNCISSQISPHHHETAVTAPRIVAAFAVGHLQSLRLTEMC